MPPQPSPANPDRVRRLEALGFEPAEVERKSRAIHRAMLEGSPHLDGPNFTRVGEQDLHDLFRRYDAEHFGGLLGGMLRDDGAAPVEFRFSSRMTSAAGKTHFRRRKLPSASGPIVRAEYAIVVSSTLLGQSFREPGLEVVVAGVACRDRLEALQRIFEHELLHLAEFLAAGASNCSAERFRGMAARIFGHACSRHEMVTPRQHAAQTLQIRVGDRVGFAHEGRLRVGRVNRITRRATVLVEDPAGRLFSDGKHYATYYVPLEWLVKQG